MRLLLLAAAIHNVISAEPAVAANHSELWEHTALNFGVDQGQFYVWPGTGQLGSPAINPNGKFGKPCVEFALTNQWFVSTLKAGMAFDFTFETFIKLNSISANSDQYVFDYRNRGFALRIRNGALVVATADTTILIQTSVAPSINTWHHVAVTRKNGLVKLFFNGVMIGQAVYTDVLYASAPGSDLGIGSYSGGAAGTTLLGSIDQFRVLFKSIYNENFTPPTEPFGIGAFEAPVDPFRNNVKLHISSNAAGNAFDTTGNAMTPFGGATTNKLVKKMNESPLNFPTAGSYLNIPNAGGKFNFGSEDFTVELWYNNSALNSGNAILVGMDSAAVKGAWAFKLANNRPSFVVSSNGTSYAATIAPTLNVKIGMWHHLAISRVGSMIYAHVNGYRISMTAFTVNLIANSLPLTIGADSEGAQQFTGMIAGLRITRGVGRYTSLQVNPRQFSDYPTVAGDVVPGRDVNSNGVSLLFPFTDNIVNEKSHNNGHSVGNAVPDAANPLFSLQTVGIPTGTNSGISLSASFTPLPGLDFTVESWVKTDYLGSIELPIVGQLATSGTTWWMLCVRSGKLVFRFASTGDIVSPNNISDNTWHHVAVTRKGSVVRMFVDGLLVSTISNSTLLNSTIAAKIGFNNTPSIVPAGSRLNLSRLRITSNIARYVTDFTANEATIPLKNCSA